MCRGRRPATLEVTYAAPRVPDVRVRPLSLVRRCYGVTDISEYSCQGLETLNLSYASPRLSAPDAFCSHTPVVPLRRRQGAGPHETAAAAAAFRGLGRRGGRAHAGRAHGGADARTATGAAGAPAAGAVRALWSALDQAPETRTDAAMTSTSAASGARASKSPRADERAAKACDDADSEEKTPCPGARLVVSDDEDGELRGCAREGEGSREI